MSESLISRMRAEFHAALLSDVLSIDAKDVPSNADKDSSLSVRLALAIANQLKAQTDRQRLQGQTSGSKFESVVAKYLRETFLNLQHLRPGIWEVTKVSSRASAASIIGFEQYSHLVELYRLSKENPSLAAALGSDYLIAPDVVICRNPEPDEAINSNAAIVDEAFARLTPLRKVNEGQPTLHASISCKWTLRSDRAQNAKSEALNLIRNRKGHLPHAVAVTGEPLPSRIASLALGTGDLDCVYHFALMELESAVQEVGDSTSRDLLQTMIRGKRLKDISDLPLDLCI